MSDTRDIVERLREALAEVQNFCGDLDSDDFNDACAGLRFRAAQAAPAVLALIDAQAAEIKQLRADLATSMETLAKAQALQAEMLKERAALAQPAAPGWQWVPVEPTRAMLEAFFGHHRFDDSWLKAYRDMLAAAPQAPQPGGAGHTKE